MEQRISRNTNLLLVINTIRKIIDIFLVISIGAETINLIKFNKE